MKILEQRHDGQNVLHSDKDVHEVLREQYEDTCLLRPREQYRSTRKGVDYMKTYDVVDRRGTEDRSDPGTTVGVLVEIP